jgi:predicted metal-dependent HD superfamily phosphohydrolase
MSTDARDTLRRCAPAGLVLADALLDVVESAYATPGRAYHGIDHIEEVAGEFLGVTDTVSWNRPNEVYLAVLFHDAIYVPGARDNETRSAELAKKAIAEHLADQHLDAERVVALIERTAQHGNAGEVDRDMALFLDCDMAILGAPPARFDAYDAAIAVEYSAIPRDAYAAGRRAFLSRLLASPRIFLSDRFHEKLDAAARANLRRALTREAS